MNKDIVQDIVQDTPNICVGQGQSTHSIPVTSRQDRKRRQFV